jgi:hypothetical protein
MRAVDERLGDDGHIEHESATAPEEVAAGNHKRLEGWIAMGNSRHALGKIPRRFRERAAHIWRRKYRQDVEKITEESKYKEIYR